MSDYRGISRAVREELEHITEAEYLAKHKQKPKDNSFWVKLRASMLLLINKEPK